MIKLDETKSNNIPLYWSVVNMKYDNIKKENMILLSGHVTAEEVGLNLGHSVVVKVVGNQLLVEDAETKAVELNRFLILHGATII